MWETSGEVGTSSEVMYSCGPLHIGDQRQDDHLEPTYSSSVPIRDVPLKTCRKQGMIGRCSERVSNISVLMAQHNDDIYEDHKINFQTFFVWALFFIHETVVLFEVNSSGCNGIVVPFQQLPEGPMEVLCERVNDLRHSLFHRLNYLVTIASELKE